MTFKLKTNQTMTTYFGQYWTLYRSKTTCVNDFLRKWENWFHTCVTLIAYILCNDQWILLIFGTQVKETATFCSLNGYCQILLTLWAIGLSWEDPRFFKRGAPKLRTGRTLAPVRTCGVWGGCAPSEADKHCNFQSQFARFGDSFCLGCPHKVRRPISAKNRGGARRVRNSLNPPLNMASKFW